MITIKQFAEWLLKLPADDQAKELHCVQLCSGSKLEELRAFNIWNNQLCVDDNGG